MSQISMSLQPLHHTYNPACTSIMTMNIQKRLAELQTRLHLPQENLPQLLEEAKQLQRDLASIGTPSAGPTPLQKKLREDLDVLIKEIPNFFEFTPSDFQRLPLDLQEKILTSVCEHTTSSNSRQIQTLRAVCLLWRQIAEPNWIAIHRLQAIHPTLGSQPTIDPSHPPTRTTSTEKIPEREIPILGDTENPQPTEDLDKALFHARQVQELSTPEAPFFDIILSNSVGHDVLDARNTFAANVFLSEMQSLPGGIQALQDILARHEKILCPKALEEINQWIEDTNLCLCFSKHFPDFVAFSLKEKAAAIRKVLSDSTKSHYLLHKTSLILSALGLTRLPPEIKFLTELTYLDLLNNRLTSLPPEIKFLTQLTYLDLSKNRLTSLPPEIKFLTNLWKLLVNDNRLTSLPPEIKFLTQLKLLDLSYNRLTSLPPEIKFLTQLGSLCLDYNSITSLPPEIKFLTNLWKLLVNDNRLTSLPPEIKFLTQLKLLDLSYNRLTSLPPEIKFLTQLTYLDLSYNRLTSLPSEIQLIPVWKSLKAYFGHLIPTAVPETASDPIPSLPNNNKSYAEPTLHFVLPEEREDRLEPTNRGSSIAHSMPFEAAHAVVIPTMVAPLTISETASNPIPSLPNNNMSYAEPTVHFVVPGAIEDRLKPSEGRDYIMSYAEPTVHFVVPGVREDRQKPTDRGGEAAHAVVIPTMVAPSRHSHCLKTAWKIAAIMGAAMVGLLGSVVYLKK